MNLQNRLNRLRSRVGFGQPTATNELKAAELTIHQLLWLIKFRK